MADTISMEDFGLYLTDLCEKEVMNAELTLDEVIGKRAVELKERLTNVKLEKTGAYRKGWRIRTERRGGERVKVLYNANRPDLTYLLEYGTHNRDGSVRMAARPHIRPALEAEIAETMDELLARL